MSKRKAIKNRVSKTLKKEVNVPVPVPKNKFGEALTKKRRLPLTQYFKDSFQELRRVTWPSRRETLKLTLAVVIFTAAFTVFTAVADLGINKVVERILL